MWKIEYFLKFLAVKFWSAPNKKYSNQKYIHNENAVAFNLTKQRSIYPNCKEF